MFDTEDTIVAIASAPGPAVRGIVRIAGPETVATIKQHFRSEECLDTHLARSIEGWVDLSVAPRGLPVRLYLWPTRRSYTGQPTAELHTVGSPPLLQLLVTQLCRGAVRLAQPGEFTLRAFLAGRLDLPQAEAVLGVIDSVNDGQFKSALSQLSGGISTPLNNLRDRLLNLLADLEAGLDFVDEDIEFVSNEELLRQLLHCQKMIADLTSQMQSRTIVNEHPIVVLRGCPNAGKSTLWNALVNEQTAIVSDQPGTTRDYLEASINLLGVTCRLIDTAGIEDPQENNSVESRAQSATQIAIQSANVVVHCIDRESHLGQRELELLRTTPPPIVAITKADDGLSSRAIAALTGGREVTTSAHSGYGIANLKRRISEEIHRHDGIECTAVASTAARSKESLEKASQALQRSNQIANDDLGDELVAAEIRLALSELGKVVGAVYTDDILDRVFSRFCIGK